MIITINFFETALSKSQLTIPYVNFEDRDQLEDLKSSNSNSIFLRYRNRILFWGNNSLSGEGTQTVTREKDQYLLSNILAHSLLQQFYQTATNIKIGKRQHVYRITFFDKDVSDGRYRGLGLYKTFHMHFTPFYMNSGLSMGFTISTSMTLRVHWTIQNLQSEGIQYEDLRYDIESGKVFTNTKAQYRLANHFNYATQLKQDLDQQNAIQNEFGEINAFVESYFNKNLSKFPLPDGLQIEAIKKTTYDLHTEHKDVEITELPKPESYFYNGTYPKKENTFHQRRKISYNRPFTYDEFENRTINISIIYPQNLYQDVSRFFAYVQKELIETFKLVKSDFNYTIYEIEDFTLKSYQAKLSSIKNADLVIVVVDKAHEDLKPSASPYYFCKAEFIKRGINTQEVQIQQIRQFLFDKKQSRANYTDHNIALNIYAKLGGMAWTIKPKYRRNELIIGIGATTDYDGQPVLGLTSIFRGDGKYILGKATSVTNMVDYKDKLEQIVSSAMEDSIQDGTLDTDQVIYLIFHIFKPAGKDNEIEALRRVINKFRGHSVEYAFIHIGTGHNYRFFTYDESDQGAVFNEKRGFGQNLRGTLVQVNQTLGFLGLRPRSSVFHKIEIHKSSSFFNIEYIAEQIYQFSEMSHTSYNTQGSPITIKYPQLMARFAEKFKEGNLTYLDETSMPDQSLWFI